MAKFRVTVTDIDSTSGVGPAIVEARTPDEARVVFAHQEGSTFEAMVRGGLVWWGVELQP